MRHVARVFTFLAPVWALHACSTQPRQDPDAPDRPHYLAARAADLADSISMQFGFGPGLLVRAQCTRWVALGIGSIGPAIAWSHYRFDSRFLGWVGRRAGAWLELRDELGIGTYYSCETTGEPLFGDVDVFGLDARRAEDVAVELYLGVVGAAVTVRPIECLDFVAGMFGFDPRGDDLGA